MQYFWKLFYRVLVLPVLWGGFHFLGLFHSKIRQGLRGRKGLLSRVRAFRETIGEQPLILFHCASMGEMEALFPLAEILSAQKNILGVVHFSPSAANGANRTDNFAFYDYSPGDTCYSVRNFLHSLKPTALVISKHDVWPNLVWHCERRGIPVFLINANFPPKSKRFWPVMRSLQRAVMSSLHAVLAVSSEDAERARKIAPESVPIYIGGDSRYDRVAQRTVKAVSEIDITRSNLPNRFILVAGSTHLDDEDNLLPAIEALVKRFHNLLCFMVPHDPLQAAVDRIHQECDRLGLDFRLYTQLKKDDLGNLICVDKMGILAALYGLGDLAYVGGGFGKGVHSVLEPMIYGLPVLTGPNIEVSHEARLAHQQGILQIARDKIQVEKWMEGFLSDELARRQVGEKARGFVDERLGASKRISDLLMKELGLP